MELWWGCLGNILTISWGYLGDILRVFWGKSFGYIGDILGISLGHFGEIIGNLGISWGHPAWAWGWALKGQRLSVKGGQSLRGKSKHLTILPISTAKSYISLLFIVQIFPYSQIDRLFQMDHGATSPSLMVLCLIPVKAAVWGTYESCFLILTLCITIPKKQERNIRNYMSKLNFIALCRILSRIKEFQIFKGRGQTRFRRRSIATINNFTRPTAAQ